MPPAAAPASATAAPLAALSAFNTVAANLTLLSLSTRLNAGARLFSCRLRRSAHRGLRGTRVEVPIALAPLMIPVVLTPATITPIVTAPLGTPAISVTTALTAL